MDIFYHISQNINKNDLEQSKILLDSIDINTLKNTKSYYSLLIKYYILINDVEKVDNILLNNNLMKRDYLLYCKFSNNIGNKINVITKLLKTDEFNTKDINYIIEYSPDVLFLFDGYYCHTSRNPNFYDYSNLKQYNINKDCILDFYKSKINVSSIDKVLENKNIIIDAGNVSYYGKKDKQPNYNNIIKIINLVMKKYKNPLIIIHQRHMKKSCESINILKTKYKNNIYITPYNTYDDYYIIYSIIKNNIPVITNDKFRDHIFDMFKMMYKDDMKQVNIITNYIKDRIINYNINKINYQKHHLYNYSRCIQHIDDYIYIPNNDNYVFIYTK